jgi:hypothetical protein
MVLPSSDSPLHASATWGPVLAWCVIEGMAEVVDAKAPASAALAMFDQLRLRQALARAFSLPGDVTEDGWRAAARVRVAFLHQSLSPAPATPANGTKIADVFAGLPRALWEDGDMGWLLKVHKAGSERYFNKELHQELFWWLQLPAIFDSVTAPSDASTDAKTGADVKAASRPLAEQSSPAIKSVETRVAAASKEAMAAEYRLGTTKPAEKPTKTTVDGKKPALTK